MKDTKQRKAKKKKLLNPQQHPTTKWISSGIFFVATWTIVLFYWPLNFFSFFSEMKRPCADVHCFIFTSIRVTVRSVKYAATMIVLWTLYVLSVSVRIQSSNAKRWRMYTMKTEQNEEIEKRRERWLVRCEIVEEENDVFCSTICNAKERREKSNWHNHKQQANSEQQMFKWRKPQELTTRLKIIKSEMDERIRNRSTEKKQRHNK